MTVARAKGGAALVVRAKGGTALSTRCLGEIVGGTRAGRAALVPGAYLPSDVTTGLLYGTDIADMTHVNNGSATTTLGATDYYDTIWWNRIKMARTGIAATGTALHNCAVAGPRPDLMTPGTVYYLLDCLEDADTSQWTADDLLIDPFLWMRSDAPGGPWSETAIREAYLNSIGIKGGYGHLRNVHVKHCQDDMEVGNVLASGTDTRYTRLEHCWLEHPIWYAGALWPSQPEGTHSDNLQPGIGPNFTMLGGMIGGPDDPEELTSSGSGITWKQESWSPSEAYRKMRNMHWDRVIFWFATGGNPSVNIAYNASYPNTFADDCDILDCLFVDRADDWHVNRNNTHFAHMDSTTNRIISNPSSGSWSDLGALTYTNG